MSRKFETTSFSLTSPDKPKNGDFCVVHEAEEQGIIVLAVADGVGGRVCDWLASRTTCEVSVREMLAAAGPVPDRVRRGILVANEAVKGESGACAGMMSAVAMVVWETAADRISFANVGDTRIYRISAKGTEQLTEDDIARVRVTRDGKPVFVGGAAAMATAITRAIGQPEDLEVSVEQADFGPGEALVLATDGIHDKAGIGDGLANVCAAANLDKAVRSFAQDCSARIRDDATVVLLRRMDIAEGDVARYEEGLAAQADVREAGLMPHIMTGLLSRTIETSIRSGDSARLAVCLDYMERFRLLPHRERLIGFLDQIGATSKPDARAFNRIRSLVPKAD